MKYNFLDNYNGLKRWDSSKQERKSIKLNFNLSFFSNFKTASEFIKVNRILYIPSAVIIFLTSINWATAIIPYRNIQILEEKHLDYNNKLSSFSYHKSLILQNIDKVSDYSTIHTIASPSFLFAYFLQKSIPSNVELYDYVIDNQGFRINASGSNLEDINLMIELLIISPIINSNSIKVNRITGGANQNMSSIQSNSNNLMFEIEGKLNHLGLEERVSFYKESANYGKIYKLEKYIKLKNLFKL
tara:strand:+ start:267 stop:998 length:732 start_codon:yes stop_codon:yes gene_type:complete